MKIIRFGQKGVSIIADSNITKKALAEALKEVMEEKPFSKISISDICERCDMNRKSFYYHFADKYDLVNWIFDTEYIAVVANDYQEFRIEVLLSACRYFYENRRFYRSALQVRGQNSFLEHFHELLHTAGTARLEIVMEEQYIPQLPDFCVDFLVDGFTCAIVRWITEKDPLPPEEFVEYLAILVKGFSFYTSDTIKKRKEEGVEIWNRI